uniref:Uncharacterized protein n=1 Tax=Globodera rostochiensis TaxID=31243 RepID=A0A914I483_GLORO
MEGCRDLVTECANAYQVANGVTPWLAACMKGHLGIGRVQQNIDAVNRNGVSGLMLASCEGMVDVVRFLLSKSAQVDLTDANGANAKLETKKGQSPWLAACIKGHLEIVEFFAGVEGWNVDVMNSDGVTGLMLASCEGMVDVVTFLLSKGAQVNRTNPNGLSSLYFAAINGHNEVCTLLMDEGANANLESSDRSFLFLKACGEGHLDTVQFLVGKGQDIEVLNSDGLSGLMLASCEVKTNVVSFLLSKGAQVNRTDPTGVSALHIAAKNGHLEVCTLLVDKGANAYLKSRNDLSPWENACRGGHMGIVELFFGTGQKIEILDAGLLFASIKGKANVVSYLLSKGARVECTDARGLGVTPLYVAAQNGHNEVCTLLMDNGANTNHGSAQGGSPWFEACLEGHLHIVELFVSRDQDIEVVNLEEFTALMYASCGGKADVVNFLLGKGARTECHNLKGKTARDLAVEKEHAHIVELLDRHASAGMNLER